MATYRVGKHWERTIVEEGTGVPDAHGHRRGDKLVGVVDDPALATKIVELLNADSTSGDGDGGDEGEKPTTLPAY